MITFFCSFFQIYLCYRILNLLFVNEYRNNKREAAVEEAIMVGYSAVMAFYIGYHGRLLLFSDALVFAVIGGVFLTGVWFYDAARLAVLSVISFYFMCFSLLDVLGIVLCSLAMGNRRFAVQLSGGYSELQTWFLLAVSFLWAVLYLILRALRKGKCKNGVEKYRYQLLIMTALGFLAVYYFQSAAFLNITEALGSTWIFFLLVFFMLFAAVAGYKKYRDTKEKSGLMELQQYYLENNMDDMRELYESSSRNYHDIKNHLNAIYQMVSDGRQREALSYIEKISEPFRQLDRRLWTGNPMLDMIINCKVQECKKEGISFGVEADIVPRLPVENQDICTIFSNLLDNAVESCGKLPAPERWIRLKIRQRNSTLLVNCQNPVGKRPQTAGGRLLTAKPDRSVHGIGMQNIQRAVAKYDGYFAYTFDQEVFDAVITLPL